MRRHATGQDAAPAEKPRKPERGGPRKPTPGPFRTGQVLGASCVGFLREGKLRKAPEPRTEIAVRWSAGRRAPLGPTASAQAEPARGPTRGAVREKRTSGISRRLRRSTPSCLKRGDDRKERNSGVRSVGFRLRHGYGGTSAAPKLSR